MRVPAAVRKLTDPVLERTPFPVVSGVNRGWLWSLASAGGGYVLGRRAPEQMRLLRTLISAGDVVWDVGAHHGYVTLLAAGQAGETGWVHAFEPGPRNVQILERHLRWNGVGNVSVHPVALSSYTGTARFGGGATSKMHALGQGEEAVAVETAEGVVRSGAARAPTFLKVDVEGAEAEVLSGALPVLPPDARLLVALHSAASDRECSGLLAARGFELHASRALERARSAGPDAWPGDPDLLCIGPAVEDRHPLPELLRTHRS